MNAVLFHYSLTPIQFTVYSYLKFCCGSRDACTVNIRTMAALCNCSRSSMKRALYELRKRGFIDVKGDAQKLRNGGHRRACNRYYLLGQSEWEGPQGTGKCMYKKATERRKENRDGKEGLQKLRGTVADAGM